MAFVNEGNKVGEAILSVGNGTISYEEVTILSGQVLANNAVLGMVTAFGKYVEHNPSGGDGSENAVAVLRGAIDATDADTPGVIIARLAEVSESDLVWKTGIAIGDKEDALASLATKQIIGRSE